MTRVRVTLVFDCEVADPLRDEGGDQIVTRDQIFDSLYDHYSDQQGEEVETSDGKLVFTLGEMIDFQITDPTPAADPARLRDVADFYGGTTGED